MVYVVHDVVLHAEDRKAFACVLYGLFAPNLDGMRGADEDAREFRMRGDPRRLVSRRELRGGILRVQRRGDRGVAHRLRRRLRRLFRVPRANHLLQPPSRLHRDSKFLPSHSVLRRLLFAFFIVGVVLCHDQRLRLF